MRAVPLKAVVFDFYGTLSVSATAATRRTGISRVASGLGVPEDLLYDAITSTFTERATGALGTLEQTMQWLAERCGATPTDEQLQAACALRRSIEAVYATALRPDAVPTLRALRERDIKIGVLSDCTHELPEIWPSLPIAGWWTSRSSLSRPDCANRTPTSMRESRDRWTCCRASAFTSATAAAAN